MEKLALTCKVLYDKDWLDNMKLCKDGQVKPVIKYDSIHDWMKKMNHFQVNLKRFLDVQLNNNEIFNELKENLDWLNDDQQDEPFLVLVKKGSKYRPLQQGVDY